MAQVYVPTYEKAIRDKLKSVIDTRKTTDAITVGEVTTVIQLTSHERWAANGIYVMPGRWRSEGPQDDLSTKFHGDITYEVVCNVRSYTEADQLSKLGQLVSLVFDAIEADPLLGDQAGVGYAYVSDDTGPQPGIGGPNDFAIMQVLSITVRVMRDGP